MFYQKYNGSLSPEIIDRKTAISLENKYLYSRIPKAANSTVLATLISKEKNDVSYDYNKTTKKNYFSKLSSLNEDGLEQLNRFFKFTIVRNPTTRLRSAYLDKILGDKKKHVHKRFNKSNSEEIGFDLFLDYLEQGGINENGHWALQKDLLYFSIDKYDFIGNVETLTDDMRFILTSIYGSGNTLISINDHSTSNIDLTLSDAQKK